MARANASPPSSLSLAACDIVYIAPDVPTGRRGQQRSFRRVRLDRRRLLARSVPASDTGHSLSGAARVSRAGLNVLPAGAALLPGRDAGVRPRRRARDAARALHRRLRRSGTAARSAICGSARSLRLSDPADALRERRAGQDLHQYVSRGLRQSSANTLAELCEKIGADWSEIVPALKLDRRIGRIRYLAPGLGIAGGNLERDLATVERIAASHGTDAGVVRAWVDQQPARRDWAAHTIQARAARQEAGCDARGLGPRLQGKHPLDQELAVARDDRAVAEGAVASA